MAGIPSIIYGFFGLVVIIPIIQEMFGTAGDGILAASILLGMMILPTIINTAESSIVAVPEAYYEGIPAIRLIIGLINLYNFLGHYFARNTAVKSPIGTPIIQEMFGTAGDGILAASILLGMMILPTIINTAESSIVAVPEAYYEGIPAIRLIIGLINLYNFLGQYFARNTAVKSPIGTPIIIAPAVT